MCIRDSCSTGLHFEVVPTQNSQLCCWCVVNLSYIRRSGVMRKRQWNFFKFEPNRGSVMLISTPAVDFPNTLHELCFIINHCTFYFRTITRNSIQWYRQTKSKWNDSWYIYQDIERYYFVRQKDVTLIIPDRYGVQELTLPVKSKTLTFVCINTLTSANLERNITHRL